MSEKELAKKWYKLGCQDGYESLGWYEEDIDNDFELYWMNDRETNLKEEGISRNCHYCEYGIPYQPLNPCYRNREWVNGECSAFEPRKEKEE